MTAEPAPPHVLVLGGTGTTGRRVTRRLAAREVPVRVGSRSGVPPFAWDDASNWDTHLSGADAVYIAYAPDLAVPGAREQLVDLAGRARRGGTRRLVLLAGRNDPDAQRCEDAVRAAGPDLTALRANWFMQNFTEGFLAPMVERGTLMLPTPDVAEPFVDAEDLADIAVAALLGELPPGATFEVSGPQPLTFAEAAERLSTAAGHRVRTVSVAPDTLAAELIGLGRPPAVAEALVELFVGVLDGRNSSPGPGVEQAMGRPARSFEEFLAREVTAAGPATVGER